MVEACYTAWATTKQQVLDGINKLNLHTIKHGQYTHDAILLVPLIGTAHSVANSVSFLNSMMLNSNTILEYTESAYGASSDSGSSEEQLKSREREHKKPKRAKACKKKKKEKDKNDKP
jgi:hypothetical protein